MLRPAKSKNSDCKSCLHLLLELSAAFPHIEQSYCKLVVFKVVDIEPQAPFEHPWDSMEVCK